jgi:hypothetical protein
MAQKTCFVIMPIGDQEVGGRKVTAAELKTRYDDLIKEAIRKADPDFEVVRADEVSAPGTITIDILTRIMHSELVVADVTYPNPNVFYELGLRHACRIGTIIIRDKAVAGIPFDIAHLRHIEYENTPTGLKQLAEKIKYQIEHFSKNPERPDNQLLELAALTKYRFPQYEDRQGAAEAAQLEIVEALAQSPELMSLMVKKASGETVDDAALLGAAFASPGSASALLKALVKSGQISFKTPAGSG